MSADMKAGRELDALIAERVMCLRIANDARTFIEVPGTEEPLGNGVIVEVAFLPPYSTDIAAAWDVIETTAVRRGWRWQVSRDRKDAFAAVYWLSESIGVGFESDTPHAICVAALAAIEADCRPPLPTGGETR